MTDAWRDLWEIVAEDTDGLVTMVINPLISNIVYITWADQSTATLELRDGEWCFCTGPDISPCDIAARDSL